MVISTLQDTENNTILLLLAEIKPDNTGPAAHHPDIIGAALRMTQLYHERYPFILEWSNYQGKTALHIAAMKGNDNLVRVRLTLHSGSDIDSFPRCFVTVGRTLIFLTILEILRCISRFALCLTLKICSCNFHVQCERLGSCICAYFVILLNGGHDILLGGPIFD